MIIDPGLQISDPFEIKVRMLNIGNENNAHEQEARGGSCVPCTAIALERSLAVRHTRRRLVHVKVCSSSDAIQTQQKPLLLPFLLVCVSVELSCVCSVQWAFTAFIRKAASEAFLVPGQLHKHIIEFNCALNL